MIMKGRNSRWEEAKGKESIIQSMVGAGAAAMWVTMEPKYGQGGGVRCHQGSSGCSTLIWDCGGSLVGRGSGQRILQLCLQRKQCFFLLDLGEVLMKITESELKPTPCFQQTAPWCCHRSKQ